MGSSSTSSQHVVIAGASGLIGRTLAASLRADGYRVTTLVRRPARSSDEREWLTPQASPISPDFFAGVSAVCAFNGASIGKLPWSQGYRTELRESRLAPTTELARALRACGSAAPHWVSASAVGVYGHRPGEVLDERSAAGDTFLAQLCVEWETAALLAGSDVATTLIRTAPLLHPSSTLKPMIALTKVGLGGKLGSGRQYWPWISLRDEVRAIRHVLDHRITGAVNLSGPARATAGEIGAELARVLRRPFVVPAPAFALRAALGVDAADSLLLADAQVEPRVLLESGFSFVHETANAAIRAALAVSE